MGDHFVLLVDRLLTESTLEAAIESRNRALQATPSATDLKADYPLHEVEFTDMSSPGKLVECRICHDEGRDSNMETPCSCCGSLQYAHRRCVQRWCNEKGDTMCEICHQPFKPGYTAPPPLFQIGRIPMNFRGNWEITTRNLNSPHFITMVSSDRNFLETDYTDYSASSTRSLICCRAVAIIFMVLLILRHTLPFIISANKEFSFPLFTLLFLRTVGIIFPVYAMMRLVSAVQRRRQLQELARSSNSSDEETEDSTVQHARQIVRAH